MSSPLEAPGRQLWGFSAEHACKLTELSPRQLRYWDQTGFFSPQYADDNRRRPYSRVYSFRDLVGLRVIAVLRKRHRIPLQVLRRVGHYIANAPESSWANIMCYVSGRDVFFDDPNTGALLSGRQLQPSLRIAMRQIASEVSRRAERLRRRSPKDIGAITNHRYIVHNASVLSGTRIPTVAVWNYHSAGHGVRQILREFPSLKRRDVLAECHRPRRSG